MSATIMTKGQQIAEHVDSWIKHSGLRHLTLPEEIDTAIAEVVAFEREECAKIAEQSFLTSRFVGTEAFDPDAEREIIARRIRARGKPRAMITGACAEDRKAFYFAVKRVLGVKEGEEAPLDLKPLLHHLRQWAEIS